MHVVRFRARGFRNLSPLELVPERRILLVYGANGQGKTNLLEALYVISTLQSFRTHRTGDLIQLGVSECVLSVEVDGERGPAELGMRIDGGGRFVTVDGRRPRRVSEYLEVMPAVAFTAADVELAAGGREQTRRYLDRLVFHRDPSHADRLRRYRRVVEHRNALLRGSHTSLEGWDESLVALGREIHRARSAVARDLEPLVRSVLQRLGAVERIDVDFVQPYLAGPWGDYGEALFKALRVAEPRDRAVGYTTAGPHRDWLRIRLNGRDTRGYASRGQLRSVALSLKLAMLLWIWTVQGRRAVFLADDPASELDGSRLEAFARFMEEWEGQVWLTAVNPSDVPFRNDGQVQHLYMEKGRVSTARVG